MLRGIMMVWMTQGQLVSTSFHLRCHCFHGLIDDFLLAAGDDPPWRSWRLQRSATVRLTVLSRAPTVAGSGQASRGSQDSATVHGTTVALQCMVTIVALSGAVAAVATAPP